MSITFPCPSCGHRLTLRDEYAGKRGKCPKCRNVITVPMSEAAEEPLAAEVLDAEPVTPAAPTAAPAPPGLEVIYEGIPVAPEPAADPAPAPLAPTAPAAQGPDDPVRARRAWVIDYLRKILAPHAHATLLVAPNIPAQRLQNARAAYARTDPGEPIVVLFDDTVMGSGKKGLVLTDRRIAWITDRAYAFTYDALDEVLLDGKTMTVKAAGGSYQLGFPDIALLDYTTAEPIGLVLQGIVAKLRGRPPVKEEAPKPLSEQFVKLIPEVLAATASKFLEILYVAPNIDAGKIKNAEAEYFRREPGERLLALFDDTVFGSAKTGFVLTDRRIVWRKGRELISIPYEDFAGVVVSDDAEGIDIHTGRGVHQLRMTVWKKDQYEAILTALGRISQRVEKVRSGGRDETPEVLRMASGELVSWGSDVLDPPQPGALMLTSQQLVWQTAGQDEVFGIPLGLVTNCWKNLVFSQFYVSWSEGPPGEIGVKMDHAQDWVDAIRKLLAEIRQRDFHGE